MCFSTSHLYLSTSKWRATITLRNPQAQPQGSSSTSSSTMATHHQQPLLDGNLVPSIKTFSRRTFYFLFSLASIFCITLVLSLNHLVIINNTSSSPSINLSSICNTAHNPSSCVSTLTQEIGKEIEQNQFISETDLLQIFLEKSIPHIANTIHVVNRLNGRVNDLKQQAALADCVELMGSSVDRQVNSIEALKSQTAGSKSDAHAWLSAVLTNHVTCMDGLSNSTQTELKAELDGLIERARASLAMFTATTPDYQDVSFGSAVMGQFPSWVTIRDRKLLESLPRAVKSDVVVANDGSGKFKTIQEAVTSAPDNSNTRYVIYVKKGIYKEQVEVGKSKKNLMIVGDGMDATIITGSLNVVDGSTTFNSATLIVTGDGFIAQDIGVQNTAGPAKQQAVALRLGADQSVINRCKLDAYQDTLYAHSLRQFYRDCYVTGTVDFIFGDAAMVLQKCSIVARKPMGGQANMLTAQGRTDPNQNTGISIQDCNIFASSDLLPVKNTVRTYLGRPWKLYSRTVIMQSAIGDHIDPSGWSIWDGDFALKTLYYGEYQNRGAGAGRSKRVNWPGYKVITNSAEANKFTVSQLIQGGMWLKSTGVAFTEGL